MSVNVLFGLYNCLDTGFPIKHFMSKGKFVNFRYEVIEFFVLNPILSNLAILFRLGL